MLAHDLSQLEKKLRSKQAFYFGGSLSKALDLISLNVPFTN